MRLAVGASERVATLEPIWAINSPRREFMEIAAYENMQGEQSQVNLARAIDFAKLLAAALLVVAVSQGHTIRYFDR